MRGEDKTQRAWDHCECYCPGRHSPCIYPHVAIALPSPPSPPPLPPQSPHLFTRPFLPPTLRQEHADDGMYGLFSFFSLPILILSLQ